MEPITPVQVDLIEKAIKNMPKHAYIRYTNYLNCFTWYIRKKQFNEIYSELTFDDGKNILDFIQHMKYN